MAAALAAGHSFDRSDVRIIGDVDLRRLPVVRAGLRCQRCLLKGRLLAHDVRFKDAVDLDGSRVTGRVDLRGAFFAQGLDWRGGIIGGPASASLAVFGNLLDADGLIFGGPADFTGTQFRAAAFFVAADFHGPALFDEASFGATASFAGGPPPAGGRSMEPPGCLGLSAGAFVADATFTDVTFAGDADFRHRCFNGTASFAGMNVHGTAAFDFTWFLHQADFSDATVGGSLSFLSARFVGQAVLTGFAGGGDLRFDQAALSCKLFLSQATVTGTLSFMFTQAANKSLQLSGLKVGGLVLDPNDIAWVSGRGERITRLQQVEATARASGQAPLANEARFDWLFMAGDRRPGLSGTYDRLVYRDITGYLVLPLYPLRALAFLIAAGIVVNVLVTGHLWWWPRRMLRRARLRRRQRARPPSSRQIPPARPAPTYARPTPSLRRRLARAGRSVKRSSFARALVRGTPVQAVSLTLRTVLWRFPTDSSLSATARFLLAVENWAGKALIVAFLMSVANANATLHQFIISLLGSKP